MATGARVGPKEKNCAPEFGTDGRAPGLLNKNGLMGVGATFPSRLRCDGMLEEWVNLAALAWQTDICLDFLQLLSEKDKGGTEQRITEPTSGQKLILWFPL